MRKHQSPGSFLCRCQFGVLTVQKKWTDRDICLMFLSVHSNTGPWDIRLQVMWEICLVCRPNLGTAFELQMEAFCRVVLHLYTTYICMRYCSNCYCSRSEKICCRYSNCQEFGTSCNQLLRSEGTGRSYPTPKFALKAVPKFGVTA